MSRDEQAQAIGAALIKGGMLHHGPRFEPGPPWESSSPMSWGYALYDAGLRVIEGPRPARDRVVSRSSLATIAALREGEKA